MVDESIHLGFFFVISEIDFKMYLNYICRYPEDILTVLSTEIRPRARTLLRFSDVQIGQHIMANYNVETPDTRGFWYDCCITDKKDTRTSKELTATVYIG